MLKGPRCGPGFAIGQAINHAARSKPDPARPFTGRAPSLRGAGFHFVAVTELGFCEISRFGHVCPFGQPAAEHQSQVFRWTNTLIRVLMVSAATLPLIYRSSSALSVCHHGGGHHHALAAVDGPYQRELLHKPRSSWMRPASLFCKRGYDASAVGRLTMSEVAQPGPLR